MYKSNIDNEVGRLTHDFERRLQDKEKELSAVQAKFEEAEAGLNSVRVTLEEGKVRFREL